MQDAGCRVKGYRVGRVHVGDSDDAHERDDRVLDGRIS